MFDVSNNKSISKLVLLFALDKIEIPMTEDSILEMCYSENNWISYMLCKEILAELADCGFVYASAPSTNVPDSYYSITQNGRNCLDFFFVDIPSSMREEITKYAITNRLKYKKKQEYFKNYYKNKDGSYTAVVKIVEPLGPKLELKLNVPKDSARLIYKNWEEKASEVYTAIYDILIDDD